MFEVSLHRFRFHYVKFLLSWKLTRRGLLKTSKKKKKTKKQLTL